MVRLTLPLLFVTLVESGILFLALKTNKLMKYISSIALVLFVIWNFAATSIHENSSTYLLETHIFNTTQTYIKTHKNEILKYNTIYFKDTTHNLPKGWNGSEKLYTSFSNNHFIEYFIPEKKFNIIYGFQHPEIPKDAYILESNSLLK
jgi:hypothetical protein